MKHRANDIASLLGNWENVEKALVSATNATGSAEREHAKYVDSLQGRLNSLQATWQAFSQTVMNSDLLKGLVSAGDDLLKMFDGIINTVGALPTLLGLVSGALSLNGVGFVGIDKQTRQLKLFGKTVGEVSGQLAAFKRGFASSQSGGIGGFFNGISGGLERMSHINFDKQWSGFQKQLNANTNCVKNFKSAIVRGVEPLRAFDSCMTGMDEKMRNTLKSSLNFDAFAQGGSAAAAELQKLNNISNQLTASQKSMAVAAMASNNSFKGNLAILSEYNNKCKTVKMGQQEFVSAVAQTNPQMARYLSGVKAGTASMSGYIVKLIGAKVATFALEAASMALNMALTMGISLIVSGIVSAISDWIHANERLAESVEEATSSYKSQHGTLIQGKSDFEETAKSYEKLSKGVDRINGKNINLSTEEYEEYCNVVNRIAELNPGLVRGYDEQGNAILNCASDVDTLTDAYNKLIIAENNKLLKGDGDEFKGFKDVFRDFKLDYSKLQSSTADDWINPFDDWKKKATVASADALQGIFDFSETEEITADSVNKYLGNLKSMTKQVSTAANSEGEVQITNINEAYSIVGQTLLNKMKENGVELENFEMPDPSKATDQEWSKFIAEAYKQKPEIAREAIADMEEQLNAAAEETRMAINAFVENAFLKGDYANISSDMQGFFSSLMSGLDAGFLSKFKDSDELSKWTKDALDAFSNIGVGNQNKLKDALDMQSEYANGDIAFGQMRKGAEDALSAISSLPKELQEVASSSLGLEDLNGKFDDMKGKLESVGLTSEEATGLINGLSAEEVSILCSMGFDGSDYTPEEIKELINEKLVMDVGVQINIEDEKEKIESLGTALNESLSGSGLSTESLENVKSIFYGLDGYDPSKLFERTANGIRLNTQEYQKLNNAYANGKEKEIQNGLDVLGNKYLATQEKLAGLKFGTDDYNKTLNDLEGIEKQIQETEQLAAQYEGLTSAYNQWQAAESAGNQRDMYESIISGFESVEDELSRGWVDDGTIEFIELLSGEDLSSGNIDKIRSAWEGLDKTIKDTSYSVKDFFTTNEDGESTSDGVYNFLDAVGQLEEEKFGGKDVVQRDGNGNIIGFDFKTVGGDKVIAEALGVSEELVQIMVRAADDAGFVVSMDGTYQQLDVLREKAQTAAESLKSMGKTDVDFNFNSTDVDDLNKQLEEANKVWEQFKNNKKEDGTIDMSVEGAEEAFTVVSTLTTLVDQATQPVYMDIQTSQVGKEMQEPLSKLQEFERLSQAEHQLNIKGADTSELKKSKTEILDYFENLDVETKMKLGIDGLSREEIEKKVDAGEIEIPATVDLQLEMDEKLGMLVDTALHEAGVLNDEEYQKRVDIYLDANVDGSEAEKTVQEQTKAILEGTGEGSKKAKKFVDGNDAYGGLNDDQKLKVVKFVADTSEIDNYKTPEDKTAIVNFIKDVEDVESYTPEQKNAIVEFVASNPDFLDKYDTSEEKKIVCDFVAQNPDFLEKFDDPLEQEVVLDYVVENGIDAWNNLGEDGQKQVIEVGVDKTQAEQGISDLQASIDKCDDKQLKIIADVIGKIDVEQLKSAVSGLDDKTVQAIAEAMGKGDVQGLQDIINGLDDKTVQAIAQALGYNDVESLKGAIGGLDGKTVQAIAQALGITDVNSLRNAVDGLDGKTVKAIAQAVGAGDVISLQSTIDSLKGRTVDVVANLVGNAAKFITGGGGSPVNGTANASGTAHVNGTTNKSGKAFKHGSWGTKGDGVALGGELGTELLVRDGRWYAIGENGAEFFGYKKGDIIFNHKILWHCLAINN